ncbi:hypothetical protein Poly51_29740 [Rubripirellula tenax]|uniref:Secreted protein n=1 Tax=Rubripirellula tenax TaxID=2528015 RepID=A0A5C6F5R8_9BACT|nr:hypothetical protein [Rubripirellula tenax]TWU57053.1 hypothetical protein Poly51_29740 [Rubripirellula tenax]
MRHPICVCLVLLAMGLVSGCGEPEPTVIGAGDDAAFTDPNLNPGANPDYDAVDEAVEE